MEAWRLNDLPRELSLWQTGIQICLEAPDKTAFLRPLSASARIHLVSQEWQQEECGP